MPTYNKLVRDKIPNVIEATGKSFRTRNLDEEEYIKELKLKLAEEVGEYQATLDDGQAIEELADVMEIVHALARVHGSTIEEVDKVREEKANKRGGFQERIFLIDVEDE
ncbi:putative house-cleaning noncanonical NTP pyrophosphatase (MazG superfamily) [Evansella vedderi]|uniref:House-cleaning noncanonical NTP pyrophosphatase (MazG superfamily) n=1 Tax=Evansella vedderi TaxID=38282 RepID=A0ABT9ZQ52_9BACI|nr:nucleoside triphosphate pyrophosphohydrolase [Evansella vedderi]MDQ0253367.1 putative house-cleaning noncanonical NTP pyrophosphatase (MazG superfamily) [Evansella vedderi]